MATIQETFNTTATPRAYKRTNPIPLDNTSIFYSLDAAESYAKESVTAYVGQIISVVNTDDDTVDVYKVVSDQDNPLQAVGHNITGTNAINVNTENNVNTEISLKLSSSNNTVVLTQSEDGLAASVKLTASSNKLKSSNQVISSLTQSTNGKINYEVKELTPADIGAQPAGNYKSIQSSYNVRSSADKTISRIEQNTNGELTVETTAINITAGQVSDLAKTTRAQIINEFIAIDEEDILSLEKTALVLSIPYPIFANATDDILYSEPSDDAQENTGMNFATRDFTLDPNFAYCVEIVSTNDEYLLEKAIYMVDADDPSITVEDIYQNSIILRNIAETVGGSGTTYTFEWFTSHADLVNTPEDNSAIFNGAEINIYKMLPRVQAGAERNIISTASTDFVITEDRELKLSTALLESINNKVEKIDNARLLLPEEISLLERLSIENDKLTLDLNNVIDSRLKFEKPIDDNNGNGNLTVKLPVTKDNDNNLFVEIPKLGYTEPDQPTRNSWGLVNMGGSAETTYSCSSMDHMVRLDGYGNLYVPTDYNQGVVIKTEYSSESKSFVSENFTLTNALDSYVMSAQSIFIKLIIHIAALNIIVETTDFLYCSTWNDGKTTAINNIPAQVIACRLGTNQDYSTQYFVSLENLDTAKAKIKINCKSLADSTISELNFDEYADCDIFILPNTTKTYALCNTELFSSMCRPIQDV
jgi:hypothetical protein